MKNKVRDSLVEDLLSIPPLVQRIIRRKLLKANVNVKVDISPPLFHIMCIVGEEGPLHIAEIGERIQVPRPQMTHLIDRLVKMGMVSRETGTTDRRTINVSLTTEGRGAIDDYKKAAKSIVKMQLSGLTDDELGDLSDSLVRLRDILSKLP
jgi:DNA-binding MarR family transcriptional regulator